jgi:glycosyltransferase involved in cell wall biosynthesis
MRIAILADKVSPDYVGGYEIRLRFLAELLSTKHEVRVYSSSPDSAPPGRGKPGAYPCHPRLARRPQGGRSLGHSALFSIGMAADPFPNWNPDVIVIEAIPYLHLLMARGWLRRRDCAKILDVAEAWETYEPTAGMLSRPILWCVKRLLAIGLEDAGRVLAPSTVTAQSLMRSYGCATVDVVPMGLTNAGPIREVQERWRAAIWDFVVLGRLSRDKRQSDFIDALEEMHKRGWRGRALIMGGGPLDVELRERVARKGLSSVIDFTGFVTDATKFARLSMSRIYVLCSEREGQSIATLEALSQGLPAIVAKPPQREVFGVSDLVTPGVNGLYYPVGDTSALARCMATMIEDGGLAEAFSAASVNISRRFSADAVLDAIEASIHAATGVA